MVTESGMGLIGVRVSTTLPNEGFTMTRDDGWFDLMVNGGGPVMLQFGRKLTKRGTIYFGVEYICYGEKLLFQG